MNKAYEQRKIVITGTILVVGIIYVIRLLFLQVLDSEYKISAENNVLRYITVTPPRGSLFDRNGQLVVYNESSYDLYVIPKQVKSIDTVEFCELLAIDKSEFLERLQKAKNYSMYKPSVFLEQLSREDFAYLQEKLFKYSGFFFQSSRIRNYTYPIGAHLLGYVGEVDKRDIEKEPYYRQGDYAGKSGIEKAYEKILRGKKGLRIVMVDVFNREKGSYQNGKYDSAAIAGKDLYLTIDLELQRYGERLMQNKRGSAVAIEPSTGGILALVSSPAYDPNLLIGRERTKNFSALNMDTLKPLFNRATMAQYPPGSTFKTLNSLIAMEEGLLFVETTYPCRGVGTTPIPCSHNHYSPLSFLHAIEQSCNPYFWAVYRSILDQNKFRSFNESYNDWRNRAAEFGLGKPLPGDVPDQRGGNLPKEEYYNKYFGKTGWRSMTIRSLSIGQGEIELTPIQLANLAAAIANRGYYYPPHVLKEVEGVEESKKMYDQRFDINIEKRHFETLIEGMQLVYEGASGSARWYRFDDSTTMCGKTGTSQNPHGENHSVFIAFAPKDNPRIAIAVVVENAGYGATWAAPIATLMIEKYLKGEVTMKQHEERMLNANLMNN